MELELVAKFTGEDADQHRLPAYEGAQSLQGIARGLVLISHYVATGTIRKRYPYSPDIRVFMTPPRRGSMETLYELVSVPGLLTLGGALVLSVTGNLLTDFVKRVFSRTVGEDASSEDDADQAIEDARPGDVDALVDAVEPAIRMAHTSINAGAGNIVLISGHNNVVNFTPRTKRYVEDSIRSDHLERLDVSVGSFNANSKYGRVFVHDLGKTVPFVIANEANPRTMAVISYGLDLYVTKLGKIRRYKDNISSDISITFRRVVAVDGRTKMFIIYDAIKIEEA